MKKTKSVPSPGKSRQIKTMVVRKRFAPGKAHLARLHLGQTVVAAAIGRTGISHRKREGDGASPAGAFRLLDLYFRADRLHRPSGPLTARSIQARMGWCDDMTSGLYNRQIPAGSRERHERLWREDEVYDVLMTTSHNQRPRIRGAGSAIFLHLARPGFEPTQGCVAISRADARRLLPRLSRATRLIIDG
jgi:L,D-peptidoglycan transpeptidase YkuD (ErfK/YbiS/YcfS/YnhG family)